MTLEDIRAEVGAWLDAHWSPDRSLLDWRQILLDGGWHDAGDLSQGLVNTAEATAAHIRPRREGTWIGC